LTLLIKENQTLRPFLIKKKAQATPKCNLRSVTQTQVVQAPKV